MKTRIVKPRYELWLYDAKNQSTNTVSREDVLSIDRQSVDHFLSLDFGIWGFRTLDGRWIEHDLSQKTLGKTLVSILDVIRCEPGEYFSAHDISDLTQIHTLENTNNLSARLRALRLVHQESFSQPHFFLSKRTGGMGVAWSKERSFLQITRIREDRSSSGLQVPEV